MNLLCIDSGVESHFELLVQLKNYFEILRLDKIYDLQVSASQVFVFQGGRRFALQEGDCTVFLLSVAPHELALNPSEALESIESLQIFNDACQVVGINQFNAPSKWERAYLKTALIRISKKFPGLVPKSILVNGVITEGLRFAPADRIVKSGYGIRRPIEGVKPQATLNRAGHSFGIAMRYRYLIQDYVDPEKEIRAYVTCGPHVTSVTLLKMPVASSESPDWRSTLPTDQLHCSVVEDQETSNLCEQLCDELDLNYVCFDFVYSAGHPHLVDVNPHGSWYWLPANCRSIVEHQLESWLIALAGEA